MDRGGGCCIARYGGGGAVYDMSKVHRIMLRFRPIAPKPTPSGGSLPPGPESAADAQLRKRRGKRKYSGDANSNKRCNCRKRKPICGEKQEGYAEGAAGVTLPLLSLSPECEQPPLEQQRTGPVWLTFGNSDSPPPLAAAQPDKSVRSWVTVECLTNTWGDFDGVGCTDKEERKNLQEDKCPGFISDGRSRVTWTNAAFRRMVGDADAAVVMKGKVRWPAVTATCTVKMQYGRGKETRCVTLPCDVWRMDGGAFAWRLDVDAALSLGR